MKKYKLFLFLLLSFFACKEEASFFEASTDELKLDHRPVSGGAILSYSLPNNREVFAMNIRYENTHGENVLKSCGYGGDSILLDGFTRGQSTTAKVTLVDNYGRETKPFDYDFKSNDSAPWKFFETLEVSTSWDGFKVSYGETDFATGNFHIFYLGENPLTQQQDTIIIKTFPISSKGDTLHITAKQENVKNTVVIRTEDFSGYRVKQEIFRDIESFNTEKIKLEEDNFGENWKTLSVENERAKTGIKYLIDGELKGMERMLAVPASPRVSSIVFGTYLAGPQVFEKPLVIDLKTEKVPSRIRLYALYPMKQRTPPAGPIDELGKIWNGQTNDKIPCKITCYGNKNSGDPNSDGWVELGKLDQEPRVETPWYTYDNIQAASDAKELERSDPLFVNINFPPVNESYRYIKFVVHDTFEILNSNFDFNREKYVTLIELEVFVKKEN